MGSIIFKEELGEITKINSSQIHISNSYPILGKNQYFLQNYTLDITTEGVGGVDVLPIQASSLYFIYAVPYLETVGAVISLSNSAPVGFSYYRKIGRCATNNLSGIEVVSNIVLDKVYKKVGSIEKSIFEEHIFQALNGEEWVLSDGRSSLGTKLSEQNIGIIPDTRGIFIRGKNNGRTDGWQDPAGERTLGNTLQWKTSRTGLSGNTGSGSAGSHNHAITTSVGFEGASSRCTGGDYGSSSNHWVGYATNHNHPASLSGYAETAPRSITINVFIKVN